MRTVYLGTSNFAAAVLRRLAASPHRPALVVTRLDRPRGRGRRVAAPPVAEAAAGLGIDVLQPADVNAAETRAAIADAAPDVLVLCAYGALVKEPLLSERPILNVHPSLLPRWRGAAPVERAIMAGDPETGVSIMRLTAGLDSGPVGPAAGEPIGSRDTYGTLAPRLVQLGGELLVAALDDDPPFVPQDDDGATYAERIEPSDRLLDPRRPAAELDRVVRALTPHIGARLELADGTALGISEALPVADETGIAPGNLAAAGGRLLLGTAAGALELRTVQPPGGRPMDAASWMRGHPLPAR